MLGAGVMNICIFICYGSCSSAVASYLNVVPLMYIDENFCEFPRAIMSYSVFSGSSSSARNVHLQTFWVDDLIYFFV